MTYLQQLEEDLRKREEEEQRRRAQGLDPYQSWYPKEPKPFTPPEEDTPKISPEISPEFGPLPHPDEIETPMDTSQFEPLEHPEADPVYVEPSQSLTQYLNDFYPNDLNDTDSKVSQITNALGVDADKNLNSIDTQVLAEAIATAEGYGAEGASYSKYSNNPGALKALSADGEPDLNKAKSLYGDNVKMVDENGLIFFKSEDSGWAALKDGIMSGKDKGTQESKKASLQDDFMNQRLSLSDLTADHNAFQSAAEKYKNSEATVEDMNLLVGQGTPFWKSGKYKDYKRDDGLFGPKASYDDKDPDAYYRHIMDAYAYMAKPEIQDDISAQSLKDYETFLRGEINKGISMMDFTGKSPGWKLPNSILLGINAAKDINGGILGWAGFDETSDEWRRSALAMKFLKEYDRKEYESGDWVPFKSDFWITTGAESIPLMLEIIPLAIAGAYGGAYVAATAGAGATVSALSGGLVSWGLSRPVESLLEGGGIYNEMIDSGESEEDAAEAASITFGKNLKYGLSDIPQVALSIAKLDKLIPKSLQNSVWKYLFKAGKVALPIHIEGQEEVIQGYIGELAKATVRGEVPPSFWDAIDFTSWNLEQKQEWVMGAGMQIGFNAGAALMDFGKETGDEGAYDRWLEEKILEITQSGDTPFTGTMAEVRESEQNLLGGGQVSDITDPDASIFQDHNTNLPVPPRGYKEVYSDTDDEGNVYVTYMDEKNNVVQLKHTPNSSTRPQEKAWETKLRTDDEKSQSWEIHDAQKKLQEEKKLIKGKRGQLNKRLSVIGEKAQMVNTARDEVVKELSQASSNWDEYAEKHFDRLSGGKYLLHEIQGQRKKDIQSKEVERLQAKYDEIAEIRTGIRTEIKSIKQQIKETKRAPKEDVAVQKIQEKAEELGWPPAQEESTEILTELEGNERIGIDENGKPFTYKMEITEDGDVVDPPAGPAVTPKPKKPPKPPPPSEPPPVEPPEGPPAPPASPAQEKEKLRQKLGSAIADAWDKKGAPLESTQVNDAIEKVAKEEGIDTNNKPFKVLQKQIAKEVQKGKFKKTPPPIGDTTAPHKKKDSSKDLHKQTIDEYLETSPDEATRTSVPILQEKPADLQEMGVEGIVKKYGAEDLRIMAEALGTPMKSGDKRKVAQLILDNLKVKNQIKNETVASLNKKYSKGELEIIYKKLTHRGGSLMDKNRLAEEIINSRNTKKLDLSRALAGANMLPSVEKAVREGNWTELFGDKSIQETAKILQNDFPSVWNKLSKDEQASLLEGEEPLIKTPATIKETEDGEKTETVSTPKQSSSKRKPVKSTGEGRSRIGTRPGLVVVGQEHIPTPKENVSPGTYEIGEDQRLGINLILDRHNDGHPGFGLFDGTGVGKTRQMLVSAYEIAKKTGKPVIIITQNKNIIEQGFLAEAEALGIAEALKDGTIEIGTYNNLNAGKIGNQDVYSAVMYDEAHNLKNFDTGKAAAGRELDRKSPFKVYATATPMDRIVSAVYFFHNIMGIPRTEVMKRIGIRLYEDPKNPDKSYVVLQKGRTWGTVIDEIVNMREEAITQGAMLRREFPFYGTINTVPIKMSGNQSSQQSEIISDWAGNSRMAGQELTIWTENQKVPIVMDKIKKDIEEGFNVIVVVESVNDKEVLMDPYGQVQTRAYLERQNLPTNNVKRTHPGTATLLSESLNKAKIKHSKIYGPGVSRKIREVESFQSNDNQVAIMTATSGGTGINLDDQSGGRPRRMYVLTVNYSGDVVEQVTGRISRRKTKTPAYMEMIVLEGAENDRKRMEIIGKKIGTLRSVQHGGDVDIESLKRLEGVVGGETDFIEPPSMEEIKGKTEENNLSGNSQIQENFDAAKEEGDTEFIERAGRGKLMGDEGPSIEDTPEAKIWSDKGNAYGIGMALGYGEDNVAHYYSRLKDGYKQYKEDKAEYKKFDAMDDAVRRSMSMFANHEVRMQSLIDRGATDAELKAFIGSELGIAGGAGFARHKGGSNPEVSVMNDGSVEKTLKGKALVNKVRELYGIPEPKAPSTPTQVSVDNQKKENKKQEDAIENENAEENKIKSTQDYEYKQLSTHDKLENQLKRLNIDKDSLDSGVFENALEIAQDFIKENFNTDGVLDIAMDEALAYIKATQERGTGSVSTPNENDQTINKVDKIPFNLDKDSDSGIAGVLLSLDHFQNRSDKFNKKRYDKIMEEGWSELDEESIWIWQDKLGEIGEKNKLYVISGHTRSRAAADRGRSKIETKVLREGDLAVAREHARRSNVDSGHTLADRIRMAREIAQEGKDAGKTQAQIFKDIDLQMNGAREALTYSYLDPNGKFMEIVAKEGDDDAATSAFKSKAKMISRMRRDFGDKFTDAHEAQLFDFISNRSIDETILKNYLEKQILSLDWDPNNRLTLKGEEMVTGDAARGDTADIVSQIAQKESEIDVVRKIEGTEAVELEEKLQKEIAVLREMMDNIKKQQMDIFGNISMNPFLQPEVWKLAYNTLVATGEFAFAVLPLYVQKQGMKLGINRDNFKSAFRAVADSPGKMAKAVAEFWNRVKHFLTKHWKKKASAPNPKHAPVMAYNQLNREKALAHMGALRRELIKSGKFTEEQLQAMVKNITGKDSIADVDDMGQVNAYINWLRSEKYGSPKKSSGRTKAEMDKIKKEEADFLNDTRLEKRLRQKFRELRKNRGKAYDNFASSMEHVFRTMIPEEIKFLNHKKRLAKTQEEKDFIQVQIGRLEESGNPAEEFVIRKRAQEVNYRSNAFPAEQTLEKLWKRIPEVDRANMKMYIEEGMVGTEELYMDEFGRQRTRIVNKPKTQGLSPEALEFIEWWDTTRQAIHEEAVRVGIVKKEQYIKDYFPLVLKEGSAGKDLMKGSVRWNNAVAHILKELHTRGQAAELKGEIKDWSVYEGNVIVEEIPYTELTEEHAGEFLEQFLERYRNAGIKEHFMDAVFDNARKYKHTYPLELSRDRILPEWMYSDDTSQILHKYIDSAWETISYAEQFEKKSDEFNYEVTDRIYKELVDLGFEKGHVKDLMAASMRLQPLNNYEHEWFNTGFAKTITTFLLGLGTTIKNYTDAAKAIGNTSFSAATKALLNMWFNAETKVLGRDLIGSKAVFTQQLEEAGIKGNWAQTWVKYIGFTMSERFVRKLQGISAVEYAEILRKKYAQGNMKEKKKAYIERWYEDHGLDLDVVMERGRLSRKEKLIAGNLAVMKAQPTSPLDKPLKWETDSFVSKATIFKSFGFVHLKWLKNDVIKKEMIKHKNYAPMARYLISAYALGIPTRIALDFLFGDDDEEEKSGNIIMRIIMATLESGQVGIVGDMMGTIRFADWPGAIYNLVLGPFIGTGFELSAKGLQAAFGSTAKPFFKTVERLTLGKIPGWKRADPLELQGSKKKGKKSNYKSNYGSGYKSKY